MSGVSQLRTASTAELFAGIANAPDVDVNDVSLNARAINRGGLFLARRGGSRHGIVFAAEAIANGAAAIAYEPPAETPDAASSASCMFPVDNLSAVLATIAERFFERPGDSLALTAITGTNGKTTVAWLLANALNSSTSKSAYLGTVGAGVLPELEDQRLTTPDVVEINRRLREFVDAGATYATLEASSHALAQDRLQGLPIQTAVFTNLSHDHLDYHGTMEAYFEAKALLFARSEIKHRIIVVDDDAGQALAVRYPDALQVSLSARPASKHFVYASNIEATGSGYQMDVETHLGNARMATGLIGRFNLENLLAAFAALLVHGISPSEAADRLASLRPPAGRMQVLTAQGKPTVVVDFAHTPAALATALAALRDHCTGRLWCVFGCGGDRDVDKRALMGHAAVAGADELVVTSDNPRSESPDKIIADIVQSLTASDAPKVVVDREEAVRFAIRNAEPGDYILVAGKGHERYQEIAGVRAAFSDIEIARAELAQ